MGDVFLSLVIGLVLGSFPTAYIVVRATMGLDVRRRGSGNVGALNSFLVTKSPAVGLVVLVSDVLKGVLAVLIPGILFQRSFPLLAAGCLGAVLGHNYSPWLGGKGGRGLATAAGALLVMVPILVPLWVFYWGLGFLVVREVNVGSAVASVASLASVILLPLDFKLMFAGVHPGNSELNVFFAIVMVVILMKLIHPVREYMHTQRRL